MRPRSSALRRAFMGNQLLTTQSATRTKNIEREANEIEWLTLFRRNWHIYVDMVLGIKLRPFQMIMIYLMGISNVFFAICSRGLSKSFMAGLGAICKMNLYPYSEIVITSSTVSQANKLADKKIRDEIIKKLSPYLLYMYEHEYIVITKPDDGTRIENKLNGSTIVVLPCVESSRGERATLLIYEEVRLLKKGILDAVFEKMPHPRQAKYLDNPLYAENPRWVEQCQRIYITSARYKFEWFWGAFKQAVTNHFVDKRTVSNVFAGDIFMAIENRLKTWADYRKGKQDSELDHRCEDLNEMIGEADDAFFKLKTFKENQILEQCFRPPTVEQLYLGAEPSNAPREDNEVRLIISDFAFANTTTSQKNDNTQIMCMSLHWRKTRFERHVDYMEQFEASDSLGAADRIRGLVYDYGADYYILDLRNGGETLYNYMSQPKDNPERGANWNPHGLGISEMLVYQVVPTTKLDDLRSRVVDNDPQRIIIPMIGTQDLNSQMWITLRKQLDLNNIKFLVSMQDRQNKIEDDGSYFTMTAEEIANDVAPYGEVDMLIQECIELRPEYRNDKIKLVEPRSGTKDRAVILSYGNYIASLIEQEWLRQQQTDDDDLDDIELVW